MGFVTWGRNPWSQEVLMHVSWTLLYVSAAAGALFMVGHMLWVRLWPTPAAEARPVASAVAARIPERVTRHSLAARLFHWVMAAALKFSGPTIQGVRLAVGAVAARPLRLTRVEQAVTGKPRTAETAELAGRLAVEGAIPLRYNGYKIPLLRNLVKRAIRGTGAAATT